MSGVVLFLGIAVLVIYMFNEKDKVLKMHQAMLSKERAERAVVEVRLDKTSYQYDFALRRLDQIKSSKGKVSDKLSLVLKERDILERQVQEYAERLHNGEPEVIIITRDTRPSIESVNLLVEKKMGPAVPLDGKIIAVNEAHPLVVVSLGSRDGIRFADTLSVYRDNSFVGSVRVERAGPASCIASIMPKWRHIEFRENDEIER